MEPTIITGLKPNSSVVLRETFAPIVYALKASSLDEAIQINNSVEQGLSSSVFTQSLANIFQVRQSESQLKITCTCTDCFSKKTFLVAWSQWLRLRHYQCEHSDKWCGDRWSFWWREGHRRWQRVWV